MKIQNSTVLRQKLEGLVKQERIAPSDVEQLLSSPDQLRAVLEREDAFDAQAKSAFEGVLGAPAKGEAVDVKAGGFAPKSVHSLLVTEKATSQTGPNWFDQVDAKMPPLFDPAGADAVMTIGSLSIQAQDMIDIMSKVSSERSAWRGMPLVDTAALTRLLR